GRSYDGDHPGSGQNREAARSVKAAKGVPAKQRRFDFLRTVRPAAAGPIGGKKCLILLAREHSIHSPFEIGSDAQRIPRQEGRPSYLRHRERRWKCHWARYRHFSPILQVQNLMPDCSLWHPPESTIIRNTRFDRVLLTLESST